MSFVNYIKKEYIGELFIFPVGLVMSDYAIRVYKQYFNFASSHFMFFENGSREPLHGHNYKVSVRGDSPRLTGDMVFDFLNIKPIVRTLCNSLDHKLLLPQFNPHLKILEDSVLSNYKLVLADKGEMSIPQSDILILPIANTSAELLAQYLAMEINKETKQKYNFYFSTLEVEVEETPGQSAIFILREEI